MLFFFFLNRIIFAFQLECEVKEKWLRDQICSQWEDSTNCFADDKSTFIYLRSIVRKEPWKQQHDGHDCLFFLPRTNYSRKCKTNHAYFDRSNSDDITIHFIFKVIEDGINVGKPVTCPKKINLTEHGSFNFSCTGKVNDESMMNLIVEPSVNDASATSYPQFWYFFLALAISWIGMAVVVSVGDAICFDLLGKRSELYGNQRLWGSVGFGIFNLLAGFWVDSISGQQAYKNYSVIYYLMAAALLPNTMVSTCLEVSSK